MLKPGRYRHFRNGDLYLVHRVVRNATNEANYEPMVHYEALDKSRSMPDGGTGAEEGHYVRRLSEFVEVVEWPDGVQRPRWVADEAHFSPEESTSPRMTWTNDVKDSKIK